MAGAGLLLCACACALLRGSAGAGGGGGKENHQDTPGPVVVDGEGQFLGSWMATRGGRRFEAYRGIRYAEPPTGARRFQPPEPITRYSGEVDAREEGPACPQPSVTPGFRVDEDCLRLNVYTPASNRSALLPVVVYIHPGGLYAGSGRSDVAGPHYMLERDVVLVTINYRLGALGFLSTGSTHAVGNYGLKDQVVALRWVRGRVRLFGGDPGTVTALGYSAGSLSIALHTVSPMGTGLFQRAISMSASPLSQVVIGPHQRHLAVRQAALVHCPTADDGQMVACLRTVPWQRFADTLHDMFEFGWDPVLLWNAVIEPDYGQERYLTEQPLHTLEAGRASLVPYVVGQTSDEFFWKAFSVLNNATLFNALNDNYDVTAPAAFMLPPRGAGGGANATTAARRLQEAYLSPHCSGTGGAALSNDSLCARALGELYSDAIIGFAAHRLTRLLARYSPHRVFQYEFTYTGNHSHYEDPVSKKPTGAAHHDELIYLFTLPAAFPAVAPGSEDDRVVHTLTQLLYNFAKYGDPSPGTEEWPAYTPARRRYLQLGGVQNSVQENLFEERYKIWDELYPVNY